MSTARPKNSPSVRIHRLAPYGHLITVAPHQGVRVYVAANTLGQDAGLTAQNGELYGLRGVGDDSLAGQPVAAGEEILVAGMGGEALRPLFDLHDTFMATASPPAG